MTGINTTAGAISQVWPGGSLQVKPARVGKTNEAGQDIGVHTLGYETRAFDEKHRSVYERTPVTDEYKAERQLRAEICANQSMIGSPMSGRVNNFIDS